MLTPEVVPGEMGLMPLYVDKTSGLRIYKVKN